ncbi:hypothetical protein FQA39_LY18475 [Lamprigera yunnana]|nr:hypothetical protein FQA39_LY18475 [Lamprigera yunnana]
MKPCCVPGCSDKVAKRFVIPSEKCIRDIWLQRINYDNLIYLNYSNLKHYRVCKNHFLSVCCDDAGKLKRYSLPTIYLPEILKGSTQWNTEAGPSWASDSSHLKFNTPTKTYSAATKLSRTLFISDNEKHEILKGSTQWNTEAGPSWASDSSHLKFNTPTKTYSAATKLSRTLFISDNEKHEILKGSTQWNTEAGPSWASNSSHLKFNTPTKTYSAATKLSRTLFISDNEKHEILKGSTQWNTEAGPSWASDSPHLKFNTPTKTYSAATKLSRTLFISDNEKHDSEGNELHNYVLENGGTISPVSIHTPTTSSDSTATNTNFRVKRLRKSNINNEVALKLMEEARDQLVSMNTATTSTYDSFEIFGATVASELRLLKTPMLIRKAKKEILSEIQSCQEEEENNEI